MKKKRLDLDAGVAHQGVAKVAVFPAGERFDDEDLEFFRPDGDSESLVVIVRDRFVGLDGEMEVEIVLAGIGGRPDEGIRDFAEGGDRDGLAGGFALGAGEDDVAADLAVEMAADVKWDGDLIAQEAVRGDVRNGRE